MVYLFVNVFGWLKMVVVSVISDGVFDDVIVFIVVQWNPKRDEWAHCTRRSHGTE